MEARASIIHVLHWAALGLETIGVVVIVLGAILATLLFFRAALPGQWEAAFRGYRANLGRGILLGLEFLIAADIIGTVAVTPTFQSLGVLATIIAIRTILSVALEVEIEGHWPWRRYDSEKSSPRLD
jgi:uncharacterized membrane protein